MIKNFFHAHKLLNSLVDRLKLLEENTHKLKFHVWCEELQQYNLQVNKKQSLFYKIIQTLLAFSTFTYIQSAL